MLDYEYLFWKYRLTRFKSEVIYSGKDFIRFKKQYEGSTPPTHFEVKIYSGTDNFKTISSCLIFVYLNPYIYSEQAKKKKHISYFLSRNSIYTFELGTSNLGTRSKILKIYRFCDVASQLVDFWN